MITISKKAYDKIIEISKEDDLPLILRLKIIGGGCAGYQHDMMFDEMISETDEVFDINEIKVVIDQLSLQYIGECDIDYIDSIYGGGFKINSPNQKGTCGCGSSVIY